MFLKGRRCPPRKVTGLGTRAALGGGEEGPVYVLSGSLREQGGPEPPGRVQVTEGTSKQSFLAVRALAVRSTRMVLERRVVMQGGQADLGKVSVKSLPELSLPIAPVGPPFLRAVRARRVSHWPGPSVAVHERYGLA